jgi:hypothetical protein
VRSCSHWNIAPASAAPASAGANQVGAASASPAASQPSAEPAAPLAEHERDAPLPGARQAPERPPPGARDQQPQQYRRQRNARPGRERGHPAGERTRAEQHADREHAMHEQQRPQHDTDVADVEDRTGRRGDRCRSIDRRQPVEQRRAEAGRAQFAGPRGRGGERVGRRQAGWHR